VNEKRTKNAAGPTVKESRCLKSRPWAWAAAAVEMIDWHASGSA